ncbi:MAG: NADH-quinone oxidoreductase subunit C [Trueperaceae bacterium]
MSAQGEAPEGGPTERTPLVTEMVEALAPLGATPRDRLGQTHLTLPAASIREAVRSCRSAGFDQLSDVMGIDWLEFPRHQGPRFTVVYNLYAIGANERLMLRVEVDDGERVPSITPQWRAASFMERETYDLYGIEFEGHPDLRKLITPEDMEGHALRKDFPIGETPTLFNDGRFLDPASFRAGMLGRDPGLTGWKGGTRKGVRSDEEHRHHDASRAVPTDRGGEGSGS